MRRTRASSALTHRCSFPTPTRLAAPRMRPPARAHRCSTSGFPRSSIRATSASRPSCRRRSTPTPEMRSGARADGAARICAYPTTRLFKYSSASTKYGNQRLCADAQKCIHFAYVYGRNRNRIGIATQCGANTRARAKVNMHLNSSRSDGADGHTARAWRRRRPPQRTAPSLPRTQGSWPGRRRACGRVGELFFCAAAAIG